MRVRRISILLTMCLALLLSAASAGARTGAPQAKAHAQVAAKAHGHAASKSKHAVQVHRSHAIKARQRSTKHRVKSVQKPKSGTHAAHPARGPPLRAHDVMPSNPNVQENWSFGSIDVSSTHKLSVNTKLHGKIEVKKMMSHGIPKSWRHDCHWGDFAWSDWQISDGVVWAPAGHHGWTHVCYHNGKWYQIGGGPGQWNCGNVVMPIGSPRPHNTVKWSQIVVVNQFTWFATVEATVQQSATVEASCKVAGASASATLSGMGKASAKFTAKGSSKMQAIMRATAGAEKRAMSYTDTLQASGEASAEVKLQGTAVAKCSPPPPPPVCMDTAAINYGQPLPCLYPPPPPAKARGYLSKVAYLDGNAVMLWGGEFTFSVSVNGSQVTTVTNAASNQTKDLGQFNAGDVVKVCETNSGGYTPDQSCVTHTMSAGENYTFSFVNRKSSPPPPPKVHVYLVKQAYLDNNPVTLSGGEFTFSEWVNGNLVSSNITNAASGQSEDLGQVNPGDVVKVCETNSGGYTPDQSCVTQTAGSSDVTITFVNRKSTPPPPPQYNAPSVSAQAQACVDQGASNGVVNGTVNNPNGINDTATITLGGKTTTVSVAANSSASFTFSGFAPGTYSGTATLQTANKSTPFSVTVAECPPPPPPAKITITKVAEDAAAHVIPTPTGTFSFKVTVDGQTNPNPVVYNSTPQDAGTCTVGSTVTITENNVDGWKTVSANPQTFTCTSSGVSAVFKDQELPPPPPPSVSVNFVQEIDASDYSTSPPKIYTMPTCGSVTGVNAGDDLTVTFKVNYGSYGQSGDSTMTYDHVAATGSSQSFCPTYTSPTESGIKDQVTMTVKDNTTGLTSSAQSNGFDVVAPPPNPGSAQQ